MASSSAEEKLAYIMCILKYTDLQQLDYHAVAAEKGLSSANHAQKKFKAIVESAGYQLLNRKVVDKDGNSGGRGSGNDTASTLAKKSVNKAVPKKARTSGRGSKRKLDTMDSNQDVELTLVEEIDLTDSSPRKRARSATVKGEIGEAEED